MQISAKHKQIAVLTLVAVVLLLIVYFVVREDKSAVKPIVSENNKVFIDANQQQLGLISLNNRINKLQQQLQELDQQLPAIKQQLELLNQSLTQPAVSSNNNHIVSNNEQIIDPLLNYSKNIEDHKSELNSHQLTTTKPAVDPYAGNWQITANQQSIAPSQQSEASIEEQLPTQIFTFKAKKNLLILPATSVLTGTLINGVDAPTNNGAQLQPYPVLISLDPTSFLPNYYHSKLTGCFVMLSSYGELSSERAMMRGETISCITDQGKQLTAAIKAFAVGKDGKVGIAGRLVTKQGALIARTLSAGFLGSIGGAISQPHKNVVNQATASGVSSAFDKVADYYLELANSMFPLIEVNSGQTIDLILSDKLEIDLDSEIYVNHNPLQENSIK